MPDLFILTSPQITGEHKIFLERLGLDWNRPEVLTPAELIVEFAGRLCYMSFGDKQSPRTNAEYIRNIIDQGHESVLEHASWTFLLTGVSRAFSHQLVRHRIGFSYSQLSQQYHDETDATFIQPAGLESSDLALQAWRAATAQASSTYKTLLKTFEATEASSKEKMRMIRSAARSILPAATETSIVVTANARSLRHFLSLRGGIVGDTEMRLVSDLLLAALSIEAPSLFADFNSHAADDGLPIIRGPRL